MPTRHGASNASFPFEALEPVTPQPFLQQQAQAPDVLPARAVEARNWRVVAEQVTTRPCVRHRDDNRWPPPMPENPVWFLPGRSPERLSPRPGPVPHSNAADDAPNHAWAKQTPDGVHAADSDRSPAHPCAPVVPPAGPVPVLAAGAGALRVLALPALSVADAVALRDPHASRDHHPQRSQVRARYADNHAHPQASPR